MTTSNRYLTKSRFKLALECPTKLFYTNKGNEYRDQMAENNFLMMLAEGGYQVGELAKQIYPSGVEISERDHALAEARTFEYLQRDSVVLFEPAIRFGDFVIRIDILVKTGSHVELIEVKAKPQRHRLQVRVHRLDADRHRLRDLVVVEMVRSAPQRVELLRCQLRERAGPVGQRWAWNNHGIKPP